MQSDGIFLHLVKLLSLSRLTYFDDFPTQERQLGQGKQFYWMQRDPI